MHVGMAICWESIKWMDACPESDGHPWLALSICSIKDQSMSNKTHIISIRRRGGPVGHDPLCTYDAVRAVWESRYSLVRPDLNVGLPFFLQKNGKKVDTSYILKLASLFAVKLKLDPEDFGGKSFRIGGATDWAERFGEEGRVLLKQRGRWDSDCDAIYTRALLKPHLVGSASLGVDSGRDLERVFSGWIQRA